MTARFEASRDLLALDALRVDYREMRRLVLVLLLSLLPQSEPGRIEVTVHDGITDEPISGIAVTVTFRLPTEPVNQSTTLYTDPRGHLEFSGLRTGMYQFKVAGENLIVPVLPDVWIDPGDVKKVEVRAGRLLTVTGRVLGPNSEPLSRASVVLIGQQPGINMPQTTYRPSKAETDEHGEFRLVNIPPGEYYLSIKPGSGLPRVVYYPGVSDVSQAVKLSVRSSLSLGSISLRSEPVFRLSGTLVLPEQAQSLTNQDVTLYIGPSPLGVSDDYDLEKDLLSNPSVPGEITFDIGGLVSGSYAVSASVSTPNLTPTTLRANVPVNVEDRNVQGLRLILKPGVDVRGRVLVDGVAPGSAWAAVRLRCTPVGRVPTPLTYGMPGTVPLTGLGEFTLSNLPEGLRLRVEPNMTVQDAYVSDLIQGGRSVFGKGSILASASEGEVEVRIDTHGGKVETMVQDSSNRPVADATVALIPDLNLRANLLLYKSERTDGKGHAVFRGVAPGDYQLIAWKDSPPAGAVQDLEFMNRFFGSGTVVKVAPDSAVQITTVVVR